MFLSVKEICFFSLIFVITTTALIGFNQTFANFKSLPPIVSSYIVSFLITIVLMSVYKLANIQHQEKEGFHFEVSKSKKCQGYPYMQSSNPELLKECEQELSTPEGRCNASHNSNNFQYTPASNQYWENERCGQQKPNPINNCRSVNFIEYSPPEEKLSKENFNGPIGENSSEQFQENFNGPTESDLLKTEKTVCAFGPGFVQYECPDGMKFFDSEDTKSSSGPESSQYLGISGSSGPNSSQYLGISGSSGPNSFQYLGISGSSGPNSFQYLGNSGSSGPNSFQYLGNSGLSGPNSPQYLGDNSSTVRPFGVSQQDNLSHQYNLGFYQPLKVKNKFNENGTTYAYLSTNSYGSRNNRPILY